MMTMCGGDINQYEAMRRGSVEQYIVKLRNFVSQELARRNSAPRQTSK